MPLTRRTLAIGCGAAALAIGASRASAEPAIILNDASRLSPTPVARHIILGPDREAETIARLRNELQDAATANRPVAIGVARHSMGGQSLIRDGTALTLKSGQVEPDTAARTFRASFGARWHNVIATLDPIGFSPAVMQSNHDFGVASTFCVNAHGWPVPHGPFGTTVRSLRLMIADGTILTCSPTENAGLFRLAMGGYGLFGVILDLVAEMVPNQLLAPVFTRMHGLQFAPRFAALCTDPAVALAYGRLDIAATDFVDDTLMIGYRPVPTPAGGLPKAGSGGFFSELSRQVYRAQTGSDRIKRIRWFMETAVAPDYLEGAATRNTLLNEPVANLASDDRSRTDILHEYFLPPDSFGGFLAACRAVIPRSQQELLNVTLRFIEPDTMSTLAYAPTRRISAVMSFSQRMTLEAEADMQSMTRALIDRVLELGGSYYLPYRLHARRDQFERAYPNHGEFAAQKRAHDPGLLFRNALWNTWLA